MTDVFQIDGTKIGLHPQRLAQWLDAGDDVDALMRVWPLYIEISPTGGCNHRCTFCSVDYIGYKLRQIDPDALKRSLDDMAEHGVKSVMYAGEGEPLLARRIGEIINYTKAAGIDVAITTNATALTEAFVDECLASVTWLKASVNAGSVAVYAKVHQTKQGDYFRVMASLARAVMKRKASHDFQFIDAGGRPIECTLGAQIVLLPENAHTVTRLAKDCRAIGLDYLVVKPYSHNPHSNVSGYEALDYREYAGLAEELEAYNTDTFKVVYRERTMAGLYEPERAYKTCHATPMTWAYIMATGDVYACSAHLLDDRFRLGNIHEQTFSEIWQGQRRRACIEMMRSFDISVCRKNCRMEHVNRYMDRLKNKQPHDMFI